MKLQEVYGMRAPVDLEIKFEGLTGSEILIGGKPLEDVERIELVSQWGEQPTLRLRVLVRDKDGKVMVYASAPAHVDLEASFSGILKGKFESWKI